MKLSEIREIKKECDLGETGTRELLYELSKDKVDFILDDYRFIHEDDIDEIFKEELLSDKYVLGCFTVWFIADVCDLDTDVVTKAQASESFELLGEIMAKNIDVVVEKAISHDGYGHHFASYDGYEHYAGKYYFFKVG